MSKGQRYLRDILGAIAKVEEYAARGHDAFQANELIRVWIVHHMQII